MADKAQDEPQIPPVTLGTVLPTVRGAQQLTVAGSVSGFLCGPLRNHASQHHSTRYLESRAPEAFPWAGTQEPGVCREWAWGWPRSGTSRSHITAGTGETQRCLLPASSHECYLRGKCEPWKGSKGRGHHCSGFRPGIWGPRPALPFSWRPQVLRQPFRSLDATTFLGWDTGPGEFPTWPALPFPSRCFYQMLLSSFLVSVLHFRTRLQRKEGRGRECCHRFPCVRGQDLRNDSGPF